MPAPKTQTDNKPKPAVKPPPAKEAAKLPAPKPVAKAPDSKPAPAPKPAPKSDDKPKPAPVASAPIFVSTPASGPDSKPAAPLAPAPKPVFVDTPIVATPATVLYAESSYDADQINNQKITVSLCESNHVPELGRVAALCIGAGENTWRSSGCDSVTGTHCGLLQVSPTFQAMHDYHDSEFWMRYAIQHGFYGQGGLTQIANDHPTWTAGDVAEACQGAGAAAIPYYNSFRSEADVIWNRYKSSGGSSSSLPGVSLVPTVPLYANPLKDANVTAKRIDQGVDYAGTGHYSAIAAGVVTNVWKPAGGWPGNMIQYQITQSGVLDGVLVYYAEGIDTSRSPGDTFKAGDWLCSLIPNWPTATELGFASSKGNDAAWAHEQGGGYVEGQLTRAGLAMSNLIHRLGGLAGTVEGRSPVGEWPPWAPGGKYPADLATASGPGQQSAGITTVQHPSAKVGAKDYSWPATQLEAWTALDKGAVNAVVRSKAARDFAAGVTFVKATEDGS